MSRTRKTDPLPVKLRNGELEWEEVHNHERGECDLLPQEHLDAFDWFANRNRNCYRTWTYTGKSPCSCSSCSNYRGEYKNTEHRRDRAKAKRSARNWADEYDHEPGDDYHYFD